MSSAGNSSMLSSGLSEHLIILRGWFTEKHTDEKRRAVSFIGSSAQQGNMIKKNYEDGGNIDAGNCFVTHTLMFSLFEQSANLKISWNFQVKSLTLKHQRGLKEGEFCKFGLKNQCRRTFLPEIIHLHTVEKTDITKYICLISS